MKSLFRLIILMPFVFVMKLPANPIRPNLLSELQVISPAKWVIELDYNQIIGHVLQKDTFDMVMLKSNRYNDSFYVKVSIDKKNLFAIITADSIDSQVIEMHIGDYISVRNRSEKNDVNVSYIGSDSSLCACPHTENTFRRTDTPTIGTENAFPTITLVLYVLSIVDSLPVSGLGFYERNGYIPSPVLVQNISAGPVTFFLTPCSNVSYSIYDVGWQYFGSVNYQFDLVAQLDTDTVFITPTHTINTERKFNDNLKMQIVNTSNILLFVINLENQNDQSQLKISSVSGRLVKNLSINLAGNGTHTVVWNKTDSRGKLVNKGIYLATLTVNGKSISQRFSLDN